MISIKIHLFFFSQEFAVFGGFFIVSNSMQWIQGAFYRTYERKKSLFIYVFFRKRAS